MLGMHQYLTTTLQFHVVVGTVLATVYSAYAASLELHLAQNRLGYSA